MRRFVVGHISGQGNKFWFDTEEEASNYIGNEIALGDSEGVFQGNYYIDDMEHPDAMEDDELCLCCGFHRSEHGKQEEICPNGENSFLRIPDREVRMDLRSEPEGADSHA